MNNTMRKNLLLLLGLLYSLGTYATDITKYTPQAEEGIVYFLPKTAIEVNFVITKTTYQPGEFSQYANRYLRISNISTQPATRWAIKKIEARPVGIPDSTKAYVVKLKDRSVLSNVELTDEGVIKAINTVAPQTDNGMKEVLEKPRKHESGKKYMTEEILLAGSTAKMAELTAKEIYNIRESKNLILRGQVDAMPKDGASLKLIIDNLDKQETAMMELFTGITDKEDKVYSIKIVPEKDIKDMVITRFSEELGVLQADDLGGEPIYISISCMNPVTPQPVPDNKKKAKIQGAIYNMPGKGNVVINFKHKDVINQEFLFGQFGVTEVLMEGLFNKKNNTKVVFDHTTGGILKIDKADK